MSSVMHPTIQTVGGHYIDLRFPEFGHYSVPEIAHSLSHLCRFNGHTRRFYSVAQHSVMVSLIVPEEHMMDALFHDAAEAYIGDMSSPLKALMPEYRALEKKVESALRKQFGLSLELDPCIKHADLQMLATEQRDLMPRLSMAWALTAGVEPLGLPVFPVNPEMARKMFMERYEELSKNAVA